MENTEIDECSNMFCIFIKYRYFAEHPDYEEILLRSRLLALGWDYLEKDICFNYAADDLSSIKKEVEDRFQKQVMSTKFLCDTGISLYHINSKLHNLDKFIGNFNKIVLWWIEKYIDQLKQTDRINLSYENGICCLINYLLLYEDYFSSKISQLVKLLDIGLKEYLDHETINLGMRYGLSGYLSTINMVLKHPPFCQELHDSTRRIIEIFNKYRNFYDGVIQWPAQINTAEEVIYNFSDSWSYGSSMMLSHLLNSKLLNEEERGLYYRNLLLRSYLPVGDFYLINSDFYNGYAGLLSTYDMCCKNYPEQLCFRNIKKKLIHKIMDNHQKQGVFTSYEYKEINGRLIKVMNDSEQIHHSYLIYEVLWNAVM